MQTTLLKLLVLLSLIFFSCKPRLEEDEVVPKHLLSEDQFVTILTDSYLAEGAAGINVKNVAGEKFDETYSFNPLHDYSIRKSQFDSSMTYYSNHPKKLKLIYDRVLEKLSKFQATGKIE